MKTTTALFLALSLIAGTAFAEKTCTPSFDYCADELIDSKGFTKDDLKSSLKGSEYEDADPMNILYHCTNPGAIGHPKLCKDGCKDSGSEGSKSC